MPLSRRRFLRNISMTGAAIRVGLPPLAAHVQHERHCVRRDREAPPRRSRSRFLFWFNGNGIPERYWIPRETGTDYELTPCLAPLESLRDYIHVISGIDNPNARADRRRATAHHKSMCGADDGDAVHGPRRRRRLHRSVIAGAMGGEVALPLAAGRRLPGIARREHPSQS